MKGWGETFFMPSYITNGHNFYFFQNNMQSYKIKCSIFSQNKAKIRKLKKKLLFRLLTSYFLDFDPLAYKRNLKKYMTKMIEILAQ